MQIRGGDVEDDSESRSEDSDEEEIGDIILEEGLVDEEEEDDEEDRPAEFHCDVRKFKKPMIKFQCTSYTNMTNQSSWTTVPPLLTSYSNQEIGSYRNNQFKSSHTCHSQNIERHIRSVTEASMAVSGFERRDGFIRQTIRSRKLMPRFDTKKQYKS